MQSAYDCNCSAEDFLSCKNTFTRSVKNEKARKYLPLPFECDMVSYGSCVVAQTGERVEGAVREYLSRTPVEHCFEAPNIYLLDKMLSPFSLRTCYMAEYFLPDLNYLKLQKCDCETKVLMPDDFKNLYTAQWSNALCSERKELDVIAVGAYDGDILVGLAGASADCEGMYQIGIDVLPEYRRRGIAAALTSRLALEILNMGKVPFYCAAWCNIKSVGNAIKCGFRPAWVELTARNIDFVNSLNK